MASVLLLIMLLEHVLNPNPPGALLAPLRNFIYSQNKMSAFRDSFIVKNTTLVLIMGGYLGKIATICAKQHQFYIIPLFYIINQYNSKWPPPCLFTILFLLQYLAHRPVCKKMLAKFFT